MVAECVHFWLGAKFDQKKLQLSSSPTILGVTYNLEAMQLEIKPDRKAEIAQEIDAILDSGLLDPGTAGKLKGKLMFGASQLWGKVGRAFLRVISERQYLRFPLGHEFKLDEALTKALVHWKKLVREGPPRPIDLVSEKVVDAVIFTDGFTPDPRSSEVLPDRVGAVLFDRRCNAPRQFTSVVPEAVKRRWLERTTQIVPIEMIAAVLALETFADRIRGADILLLIDSEAVEGALIKGYSSREDLCEVITVFWDLAFQLRVRVFIDRISTDANPADWPSRNKLYLGEAAGWQTMHRSDLACCASEFVKDLGGFFVGVSPEWQLAIATVAFFETLSTQRATARKWSRDFLSRDVGYVRAARLGDQVYKLCIRRNEQGNLTTFFAGQLGTWDAHARRKLDEALPQEVLEERLQPMLVLHGFADDEKLLKSAANVAAAGASNLRDALRHLHSEIRFRFEEMEGNLPDELPLVVAELLKLHDEGRLKSCQWADLASELTQRTGLKGKKLLLPLRLALTGQQKGHSLSELLELFELMEQGAPWSSEILPLDGRMALLRRWLQGQPGPVPATEGRPRSAKVLALAVEGGSPPEKEYLKRDAYLSDQVEKRLRQVERMQAAIQHWKQKIAQNRQECEDRNQQLRTEKDHIAKHFQDLVSGSEQTDLVIASKG
eukprot:s1508_g2.t1